MPCFGRWQPDLSLIRIVHAHAGQVQLTGNRSWVREALCNFVLFGFVCHAVIIRRRFQHHLACELSVKSFREEAALVGAHPASSAFWDGDQWRHRIACVSAGRETMHLDPQSSSRITKKFNGRAAAEKWQSRRVGTTSQSSASRGFFSSFLSASSRKVSAISRSRALSIGSSTRWARRTHSAAYRRQSTTENGGTKTPDTVR